MTDPEAKARALQAALDTAFADLRAAWAEMQTLEQKNQELEREVAARGERVRELDGLLRFAELLAEQRFAAVQELERQLDAARVPNTREMMHFTVKAFAAGERHAGARVQELEREVARLREGVDDAIDAAMNGSIGSVQVQRAMLKTIEHELKAIRKP